MLGSSESIDDSSRLMHERDMDLATSPPPPLSPTLPLRLHGSDTDAVKNVLRRLTLMGDMNANASASVRR